MWDSTCLRSLGNDFMNFLDSHGITYEPSAPDIPAQNGHAERKGGVLTIKARALRIEGGLPQYIWNELYRTAGYIMNRTPMRKHNWKIPFELVTKQKPDLSHLRLIGCKAYTLNKDIAKDKLRKSSYRPPNSLRFN